MGLISWLFGAPLASSGGGHSINKSAALAPSPGDPPSPMNPGSFASLRTAPTVPAPRYFSEDEAEALGALAKERKQGVRHSKKAYKALESIEESDADVVESHYEYSSEAAKQELRKVKAKSKYAQRLHALRPGYAAADMAIDKADQKAALKIGEIRAKLQDIRG